MQYYRLVAVWLMRIVATNGAYEKGDGFTFSQIAMDQFPERVRRRLDVFRTPSRISSSSSSTSLDTPRKPSITNLSTKS